MSDEFIKIARQEILIELDGLEAIIAFCNNDEQIFKNSKEIEGHLHKIKGLAPMMGDEIIGEIAKISDTVTKHIIQDGSLGGSYMFIVESIQSMKNLFNGQKNIFANDINKKAREMFPCISDWQS
ncbi:Uncharacterised protein [uncultured archaeon]|nr:Uncharacterised protein [uncultured archaeon]